MYLRVMVGRNLERKHTTTHHTTLCTLGKVTISTKKYEMLRAARRAACAGRCRFASSVSESPVHSPALITTDSPPAGQRVVSVLGLCEGSTVVRTNEMYPQPHRAVP
jgi:hypothetical protein